MWVTPGVPRLTGRSPVIGACREVHIHSPYLLVRADLAFDQSTWPLTSSPASNDTDEQTGFHSDRSPGADGAPHRDGTAQELTAISADGYPVEFRQSVRWRRAAAGSSSVFAGASSDPSIFPKHLAIGDGDAMLGLVCGAFSGIVRKQRELLWYIKYTVYVNHRLAVPEMSSCSATSIRFVVHG